MKTKHGGVSDLSLNIILTYYFKTSLLSRDVNSRRRLPDVNKPSRRPVATAVLNFCPYGCSRGNFKPKFNLLFLNLTVA